MSRPLDNKRTPLAIANIVAARRGLASRIQELSLSVNDRMRHDFVRALTMLVKDAAICALQESEDGE